MQATHSIARADALAAAGRTDEAAALLMRSAEDGDAQASFLLGLWKLGGRIVPRDLAGAHMMFSRAGTSGDSRGRWADIAFTAHGAGAKRDWPDALRKLRELGEQDPAAKREHALLAAMAIDVEGDPLALPSSEALSSSPDARLVRQLLTPEECAWLIERATPLLSASLVVDPRTGEKIPNPIRTSEAAAFPLIDESPAIHAINRRLAAITGTDVRQGEPLQILRYRQGQQYRRHMDILPGASNQRVWTALVYLNEEYQGGATCFSAVALEVRGAVGDALLFRNVLEDGLPDSRSAHEGAPVSSGAKLIASRWIRARPLDLSGRNAN